MDFMGRTALCAAFVWETASIAWINFFFFFLINICLDKVKVMQLRTLQRENGSSLHILLSTLAYSYFSVSEPCATAASWLRTDQWVKFNTLKAAILVLNQSSIKSF